jgi:hypothetical protein
MDSLEDKMRRGSNWAPSYQARRGFFLSKGGEGPEFGTWHGPPQETAEDHEEPSWKI